jgi:hypothetical protein
MRKTYQTLFGEIEEGEFGKLFNLNGEEFMVSQNDNLFIIYWKVTKKQTKTGYRNIRKRISSSELEKIIKGAKK